MKNLFRILMMLGVVGFMASCSTAPEGEKVDAKDAKDVKVEAEAKTLAVDVAASKVEWVGTKTGGQHNGEVMLKSGSLNVKGEEIVGGSFVLDMNSIVALDLEGKAKGDLEGHLKTGDFFEVEKFPEAKFEITAVKAEAGEGGATHKIEGNLTLKDVTKSVTIPAIVKMENGAVSASTPQFTIDRQVWGINYKSTMKDVILNDQIGLKITLSAK